MHDNMINSVYISAACNRSPKSLDWGGNDNQIIYGFSNSIAILCSKEPFQIKTTYNKHTDRVNCVKWISNRIINTKLDFSEFISGSTDKHICVWRGNGYNYEVVDELTEHTEAINVLDGIHYKSVNNEVTTLLASSSADSTVKIWIRNNSNVEKKFQLEQSIPVKTKGFALALKFYILPVSNLPVLFIGYENNKIEILVRLNKDKKEMFYHMHSLIGHEDWIRDIDVCQISNNQLMIVSSSQDCYIRVWKLNSTKLTLETTTTSIEIGENNNDEDENVDDDVEEDYLEGMKASDEIKLKSTLFKVNYGLNSVVEYSMNLESVLYGHEDWVYSVKWQPLASDKQELVFVSASMDKTMVVWKYDEVNSLWLDILRAGDIGGNTLGFYGATFDLTGEYLVAHGFQGALNAWKRIKYEDSQSEKLSSVVINGGHFNIVEDLCWEPNQEFFLSVSKDQTTRFHGYWKREKSWHEFGRPQVHGYDMTCISCIDRFKFLSGADEKILRIFEAPRVFLKNYYNLSKDENALKLMESDTLPQGASVPALGLSNKAVFETNNEAKQNDPTQVRIVEEMYKENSFNIIDLEKPPTEEHLLQNTLWPEIQKLYGHGFEVFSCAAHPNGEILASACKASKAEYATIIIWNQIYDQTNNTRSYRQLCTLSGHELTIVQLAFSNNGKYLLSVSRDRSWKLYKKVDNSNNYELYRGISTKNPYHTRIIWSCSWSLNDKYFVTTSRDKKVCIWNGDNTEATAMNSNEKPISDVFELTESITACSFAPKLVDNNKNYLLAFGLETGRIDIVLWNSQDGFRLYQTVPYHFSHHLTIKRLSFRKKFDSEEDGKTVKFYLASCSDDYSVRLFTINALN